MFSYAEIAKQFFTGTFETLSNTEQNIMKNEYGMHIGKYTYMPSIFGKKKFDFAKWRDILICQISNYYENFKEAINQKMNDHSGGKRCVFVFFDTMKKLNDW